MDYSYCNSHGESSQEPYMHTYSLWNSSQFYNMNDLCPRNIFQSSQVEQNMSLPSFAPEVQPKREIVRDMFNRRIITKASLYNAPEFFYEPENEPESPIYGPPTNKPEAQVSQNSTQPMPPQDNWTDQYWRRAEYTCHHQKGNGNGKKAGKEKRFKKKFMDALAQPIKSTKAESIMQKMGWAGGALGKGGSGIVVPIAPNVDYAQTTIGFGSLSGPQNSKKKKPCMCHKQKSKEQQKEDFVTNTLLYILEFVRNDWETEVIFDMKFSSKERRTIHCCVNEVINCGGDDDNCDDDDDMYGGGRRTVKITNSTQQQVLRDIRGFSNYVLYTESHGKMPNRQLCLYKDAPAHVYLVTPEDFKDDPDDVTPATKEDKCDDNPFLKSITRNLKPDDEEIVNEHEDNTAKMIKFFLEFVREDSYTEFRFLGPFNNDESECLNAFLNEVAAGINNEGTWEKLAHVFKDATLSFELTENCNGSMVVHKRKKEAAT